MTALFLAESLSAWLCLIVSVIVKGVVFWRPGRLRWWQALIGTFVANSVSTLLGALLLLPVAGVWLLPTVEFCLNTPWMIAAAALALIINTALESTTLWLCNLADWSRRLIVSVLLANFITVMFAWLALRYLPAVVL